MPYLNSLFVFSEHLILDTNSFSGSLPLEIRSLTQLVTLNLNGNMFTGQIPPSTLGQLSKLESLRLGENSFALGPIPTEVFQLTSLKLLYLEDCKLSGKFPFEEFKKLPNIEDIRLNHNLITGLLTSQIGALTSLIALELGSNKLRGSTIASEIGLLANVSLLDFSHNGLEGTLPSELALLSQLSYLRVDGNPELQGDLKALCLATEHIHKRHFIRDVQDENIFDDCKRKAKVKCSCCWD